MIWEFRDAFHFPGPIIGVSGSYKQNFSPQPFFRKLRSTNLFAQLVFFPLEDDLLYLKTTIHCLMKCRLSVLFLFFCIRSFSQSQTCPVNINFATGDLTHWFAYTGNNINGYGVGALIQNYDSNSTAPTGTRGTSSIHEYNLSSILGIKVLTSKSIDPFGGWFTIPTINGYSYNYSILLG